MIRPARWFGIALASVGIGGPAFAWPSLTVTTPSDSDTVELLPLTKIGHTSLPVEAGPTPRVVGSGSTIEIGTSDYFPPFAFSDVGPPATIYAEVDFLRWQYSGQELGAMATSGSAADFIPGAIDQPGTQVLIGDGRKHDWTSGLRGRVGVPAGGALGLEAGGFYTTPVNVNRVVYSADYPVLSRPFFDTVPNAERAFSVGFPTAFDGNISIRTESMFWGLDVAATAPLDPSGTLGFVGFRYVRLDDEFTATEQFTVGPNGLAFINGFGLLPGATGQVTDYVRTQNEFCGGQLGFCIRNCSGKLGWDVRASLAFGVTSQRVQIQGRTDTIDVDGTQRSADAGFMALASNSGTFERDRVSVIPELGVKFFYFIAQGISVSAGYDALYWSSVVRAAEQLDRSIDTRQVPIHPNFIQGAVGTQPIVPFRSTDFWAHGFNVGVRLEY